MASYFEAFGPTPEWEELVRWPPDVFALANLVLDHTEAYRFVISPPPGRHWPPLPDWDAEVRRAAGAWSDLGGGRRSGLPPLVRNCWEIVTRGRDASLASVGSGDTPALTEALLTLHAVADEACSRVAATGRQASSRSFEAVAWGLLQERGSLSRMSPSRIRIVPRTHFSSRGITIRSLSRYLALSYESVDVHWRSVEPGPAAERSDYNILLLPWPLVVRAGDFRPASPALLANMDLERFGLFEFSPEPSLDCVLVDALLAAAEAEVGRVDAVVLPEAAIYPDEVARLERALDAHGVIFLVSGVQHPQHGTSFGRNYLHFGIRTAAGWNRLEQDKHHRWCLDERQIRQYHLTRALDPRRLWWEAIDIRERALHVIDVGGGVTVAPLVCEDLARLDEVADVVRRIGPTLVVAALLDGPQLRSRWPCRHACILVDEPGSSVITLTSYGMAVRSRPSGLPPSRVVAHWNSPLEGLRELELAPRASAILLATALEHRTLWTADGRRHADVPGLVLRGVHQLRAPRPRLRRAEKAPALAAS